jgi:hypothetical protein
MFLNFVGCNVVTCEEQRTVTGILPQDEAAGDKKVILQTGYLHMLQQY